jgi:hypothetical protein
MNHFDSYIPGSPIKIKAHSILTQIPSAEPEQIFWNMFATLQYLSNFYETVLYKIRKESIYVEDLVENSAMNSSLIWSGGARISPSNYCFMESDEVSFTRVEKLLKFHEINMRSLLTDENGIYSIFGAFRSIRSSENGGDSSNYEQTFISMIERLIFQVLTLFKINGNYDANLEFSGYVRGIYRTDIMQKKLKILDAKIELHVADIYI